MSSRSLLKFALAVFGTIFLLVYPLAVVWPSGWAWHTGAPHDSKYFMMMVGVYATLGVFLLIAARDPQAHRSAPRRRCRERFRRRPTNPPSPVGERSSY